MRRSLAYAALGVVLALVTLMLGPDLLGVPEATGEGDPDASLTRRLDVLPFVAGVMIAYLLAVGLVEVVRRRRSR